MSSFGTFKSRTLIRAVLEMDTALSVGETVSLEPTGTDMPVMKGPDGLPFIPGSSLKGSMRYQAERILRTLNKKPRLWSCDIFEAPCVPSTSKGDTRGKDELWEEADGSDEEFTRLVFQHSCTACRIFGSFWYASRVAVKDAYLLNPHELPVVTQVRDGVGIDRDLGVARTGVKYDFEVVVPGSRFGIELLAENLEDWELGFLLTVIKMWEEGGIAVGGKSTRGPGWGHLRETEVVRVSQENLLDYLVKGWSAAQIEDAAVYTEAFLKEVANA